jgi:hypothetical protein
VVTTISQRMIRNLRKLEYLEPDLDGTTGLTRSSLEWLEKLAYLVPRHGCTRYATADLEYADRRMSFLTIWV